MNAIDRRYGEEANSCGSYFGLAEQGNGDNVLGGSGGVDFNAFGQGDVVGGVLTFNDGRQLNLYFYFLSGLELPVRTGDVVGNPFANGSVVALVDSVVANVGDGVGGEQSDVEALNGSVVGNAVGQALFNNGNRSALGVGNSN